jgi:hypothetical protein
LWALIPPVKANSFKTSIDALSANRDNSSLRQKYKLKSRNSMAASTRGAAGAQHLIRGQSFGGRYVLRNLAGPRVSRRHGVVDQLGPVRKLRLLAQSPRIPQCAAAAMI